jgi:hypothetical protein
MKNFIENIKTLRKNNPTAFPLALMFLANLFSSSKQFYLNEITTYDFGISIGSSVIAFAMLFSIIKLAKFLLAPIGEMILKNIIDPILNVICDAIIKAQDYMEKRRANKIIDENENIVRFDNFSK